MSETEIVFFTLFAALIIFGLGMRFGIWLAKQ